MKELKLESFSSATLGLDIKKVRWVFLKLEDQPKKVQTWIPRESSATTVAAMPRISSDWEDCSWEGILPSAAAGCALVGKEMFFPLGATDLAPGFFKSIVA